MANKPMGFLNIGSDSYEIVDAAGRQATQELSLTVSQLSASNLPYSSTKSTKQEIDDISSVTDLIGSMHIQVSYNANYTFAYKMKNILSIQFYITESVNLGTVIATLPSYARVSKIGLWLVLLVVEQIIKE